MNRKYNLEKAWTWIPSLYFMEGLPYVIVTVVSGIMFARMGISNAEMTLYTAWLNLPWMLKPLWSPLVELYRSQRFWIIAMQVLIGAGFAAIGFVLPMDNFFRYALMFFWLIAFSSATHDIAIDGFYLSHLNEQQQAFFVGIRSTCYRLAMIAGQGVLLILAGYLEGATGLGVHDITIESRKDLNDDIRRLKFDDSRNHTQLALIYPMEKVFISTQNITCELADSALGAYQRHNSQAKFYENYNCIPFQNDQVGNLTIVPIRISAAPEKPVIVNVDWYSGDKSIKLIEGRRFVFTKENWNQTAYLIFQADKQLVQNTKTTFRATSGNVPLAWSLTFMALVVVLGASLLYHAIALPKTKKVKNALSIQNTFTQVGQTFISFFRKESIIKIVLFLLFYRFGETQLSKLTAPFMVASREAGGLAMTTGEVGWVYGTVGLLALTFGGVLGGWLTSKYGFERCFWVMVFAMNLPNVAYVYLSHSLPESLWVVTACVSVEQFGYGFGFTAYTIYTLYVCKGKYETSHYAIATGIMALGRMFAEMISGKIQEMLGYHDFFIWVLIATIPCFIVSLMVQPKSGSDKKCT